MKKKPPSKPSTEFKNRFKYKDAPRKEGLPRTVDDVLTIVDPDFLEQKTNTRFPNRGAEMLTKMKLSANEIAKVIGVPSIPGMIVMTWITGLSTPPRNFRLRLLLLLGVPPSAWDTPPSAA